METTMKMDRIEFIRGLVCRLMEQQEFSLRASGYVHLFGVAQACVMIALKRGEDAELACIAGYLHDIASYTTGDGTAHARRGAEMARKLLKATELFTAEEIEKICVAIMLHSDKGRQDDSFSEILKDADVMQHFLFNPEDIVKKDRERCKMLREEFGF